MKTGDSDMGTASPGLLWSTCDDIPTSLTLGSTVLTPLSDGGGGGGNVPFVKLHAQLHGCQWLL